MALSIGTRWRGVCGIPKPTTPDRNMATAVLVPNIQQLLRRLGNLFSYACMHTCTETYMRARTRACVRACVLIYAVYKKINY